MRPDRTVTSAPAVSSAVRFLRHWIDELCAAREVPAAQRADIVLAVSEALSNVVVHAYRDRPEPGTMRLAAEFTDHRLAVEVGDDGAGIRADPASPGEGLGLPMIAALATELEVVRLPSGGALVRMVFALEG